MIRIIGVLVLFLVGSVQAAEHFLEPGKIAQLTPHPDVAGVSQHLSDGVDPSQYNNHHRQRDVRLFRDGMVVRG